MDLKEIIKIFDKCKNHHIGCAKCPLNKSLISTHETIYDICDCLIEMEKLKESIE